ncbi:MAG: YggS family pyridoxal phosphate-dependent enzyme [Bacteroidales bacterium]
MAVRENLQYFLNEIPRGVTLVAVSKTKPVSDIMEAYQCGQRIFGENKVQELISKQPQLPEDIEWHLIGHLQTNKVKYIAPFVSLIESVDSLKLLKEINKQGAKINRTINCLLQFHIANESTKFGLDFQEAAGLLSSAEFTSMNYITICGVMGMATFTEDEEVVRGEFARLKTIFENLKNEFFQGVDSFKEISMGMSGDFRIAIEEGSTMVRIGSSIFGDRIY